MLCIHVQNVIPNDGEIRERVSLSAKTKNDLRRGMLGGKMSPLPPLPLNFC